MGGERENFDAFSKCHPAVNFLFFVGAIGMSVVIQHPAYLLAGVMTGAIYYLLLNGVKGWKTILGLLPMFVILTAVNPLFNTLGATRLFEVFGRPYTLEALLYGGALAGMFVIMMLWFGCYNQVLTSDKFTSLFGNWIPSISLLLVMVFRMVPNFIRKTKQIIGARKSIGNGAGKSTTLKAICGTCRPYRGKVKVFGKPIEKYKSAELFAGCLAMLPQDPKSLFVKNTVREELAEMTKNEEKISQIAATCEIDHLLERHPYDLSGGEQQRSALAKVLLTEPKLLLLDEPTKGIDSFFKEKLAAILCKLKEQGITIVMVSHDVEFCAKYADMVSMFFDGQILTTDTPRRFFGNNSFYTTAANRMSRHVFSMAVTAEDVVELCAQNWEGRV